MKKHTEGSFFPHFLGFATKTKNPKMGGRNTEGRNSKHRRKCRGKTRTPDEYNNNNMGMFFIHKQTHKQTSKHLKNRMS